MENNEFKILDLSKLNDDINIFVMTNIYYDNIKKALPKEPTYDNILFDTMFGIYVYVDEEFLSEKFEDVSCVIISEKIYKTYIENKKQKEEENGKL